MTDEELLALALAEARKSAQEGGVPIGAALAHGNEVIGTGHNQRVQRASPTRHGEIDCLENAGRLAASVYAGCTIATTLSPCVMCTGAILLYKIPRVVIGENTSFLGAEDLLRTGGVEVVVLDDADCRELMSTFVAEYPELWNEDIGVRT